MDEMTYYTYTYSPFTTLARQDTSALSRAQSSKRSSLVCLPLVLGCACGVAVVIIGFFMNRPVLQWPLVALGIVCVAAGVYFAHRQVVSFSAPSSSLASRTADPTSAGSAHQQQPQGAGRPGPPTYSLEAPSALLRMVYGMGPPSSPHAAAAGGGGMEAWGRGTVAAFAAGALVCGMPTAMDGAKPVLVLQPQALLTRGSSSCSSSDVEAQYDPKVPCSPRQPMHPAAGGEAEAAREQVQQLARGAGEGAVAVELVGLGPADVYTQGGGRPLPCTHVPAVVEEGMQRGGSAAAGSPEREGGAAPDRAPGTPQATPRAAAGAAVPDGAAATAAALGAHAEAAAQGAVLLAGGAPGGGLAAGAPPSVRPTPAGAAGEATLE